MGCEGLSSSTDEDRTDIFVLVTDYSLCEFVRDTVVKYLEDDHAEIRRAASLTCCQIIAADPIISQTSNHAIQLVNEVLEKLLTLAIADPGTIDSLLWSPYLLILRSIQIR